MINRRVWQALIAIWVFNILYLLIYCSDNFALNNKKITAPLGRIIYSKHHKHCLRCSRSFGACDQHIVFAGQDRISLLCESCWNDRRLDLQEIVDLHRRAASYSENWGFVKNCLVNQYVRDHKNYWNLRLEPIRLKELSEIFNVEFNKKYEEGLADDRIETTKIVEP